MSYALEGGLLANGNRNAISFESLFVRPTNFSLSLIRLVKHQFVVRRGQQQLAPINDKLKEPQIKYREAVPPYSPRVAAAKLRLPWVTNSNPPQPRWGCALFHASTPNVAAERQRWAGGRYRFAV